MTQVPQSSPNHRIRVADSSAEAQSAEGHIRECNGQEFEADGKNPFDTTIQYLRESEEAVGTLQGVEVLDDLLIVTIESKRLAVSFTSISELESVKGLLAQYVGRVVAILRVENPDKPLRIRIVAPQGQNMTMGGGE